MSTNKCWLSYLLTFPLTKILVRRISIVVFVLVVRVVFRRPLWNNFRAKFTSVTWQTTIMFPKTLHLFCCYCGCYHLDNCNYRCYLAANCCYLVARLADVDVTNFGKDYREYLTIGHLTCFAGVVVNWLGRTGWSTLIPEPAISLSIPTLAAVLTKSFDANLMPVFYGITATIAIGSRPEVI